MSTKYYDWQKWWDGLRFKVIRAGAESLTTSITALFGSNAAAVTFPGLKDLAMDWQQALFVMVVQFVVRETLTALAYIQTNPEPDIVEVEQTTVATTVKAVAKNGLTSEPRDANDGADSNSKL